MSKHQRQQLWKPFGFRTNILEHLIAHTVAITIHYCHIEMTPLHNLKDRVSEYFPPLPPENKNTVKRSTKNMGRDKLHQT